MKYVEKLLLEFEQRGNPLAEDIAEDEIPLLIDQLRARLGLSKDQLNLTPISLSFLAKNLMDYYDTIDKKDSSLSNEETIRIVREIAAYFSEVVIRNSEGKRRTKGGLRGMEIFFNKPSKARKGSEIRNHLGWVTLLGPIATGTWDAVILGIEPKLLKAYRVSVSSNIREEL